MTLAAVDLLVAVVAGGAAHLAGLDRLRVDDGGAGRFFPAAGFTNLATQGIDELHPGLVLLPGYEVIPDRALGEQIVRQHVPLAARPRLIEQGVDHLAKVNRAGTAARPGRRQQRPNHFPLRVRQVRAVGLPHGGDSYGVPRGFGPSYLLDSTGLPAFRIASEKRQAAQTKGGPSVSQTP